MTLDNGYGDIVLMANVLKNNNHLITYDVNDSIQNKHNTSEKITAVTHSDGSTIWVITRFLNKFFSFRVDFEVVNTNSVVSTVPQSVYPRIDDERSNITAIGYLKVSPNGKNIAIAHSSTTLGAPSVGRKKSGKVLLFDFSNTTGAVMNEKVFLTDAYPYGVEFSPNIKMLYITTADFNSNDLFLNNNLYQINFETTNIASSRQTIYSSDNVADAFQFVIDGRILRLVYAIFQRVKC